MGNACRCCRVQWFDPSRVYNSTFMEDSRDRRVVVVNGRQVSDAGTITLEEIEYFSFLRTYHRERCTYNGQNRPSRNTAVLNHTSSASVPGPPADVETTCSVCMESFEENDTVRVLPCLHHFHPSCIQTWLLSRRTNGQATCPLCRLDPRTVYASSEEWEASNHCPDYRHSHKDEHAPSATLNDDATTAAVENS